MTQYTSFVAVDKIIRETGEVVTVKQPLPLPQGVSDYAVGGYAPATRFGGGLMKSVAPMAAEYAWSTDKMDLSEPLKDKKELKLNFYITSASIASKFDLKKLEETLTDQLEAGCEVMFKNWNLKTLTLTLKVEGGKVKKTTIKSFEIYEGKACEECIDKSIKRELNNLNLPADLKGSLELKISYI